MERVTVEWDDRKNASNRRKHGIDFRDAARIFDGIVVELEDSREYDELRVIAFGEIGPRVIAVVYTWRDENRRLISARRATRDERHAYYEAIYE